MRHPLEFLQVAIFLTVLVVSIQLTASQKTDTCTSNDNGTCDPYLGIEVARPLCTATKWLYGNGGSAQAYRSGAPLSTEVCTVDMATKYRYKPASWLFSRKSMRSGSAPILDVTLKVHSCTLSTNDKCHCRLMPSEVSTSNAGSVVEIWQTKPDGTYSSLDATAVEGNECRAQVPLIEMGIVKFTTVAPGSVGLMGGLGPGGWDWNPYGPPVLHFLTRVQGHAPVLVDLPILLYPKTLERRNFFLGDFRGVAWTRGKPKENPIVIRSWDADIVHNRVKLEMDIFLQPSEVDKPDFCHAFTSGFPSSFFLEPISVCASSMLDFYAM